MVSPKFLLTKQLLQYLTASGEDNVTEAKKRKFLFFVVVVVVVVVVVPIFSLADKQVREALRHLSVLVRKGIN